MTALRTVFGVVIDGVLLLVRHLPALLAIFLLGAGLRELALTAAVAGSEVSGLVGNLILTFAPLAMLSTFILMFGVLADPAPGRPAEPGSIEERVSRRVRMRRALSSRASIVGASLLPFLAVYQSQGMLAEDRFRFLNEASFDEMMNNAAWLGGERDYDRLFLASTPVASLAILLVAFTLRQLLTKRASRSTGWSFAAAYLEITWVLAIVGFVNEGLLALRGWASSRRLTASVEDLQERAIELTGPLAPTVQWLWDGMWSIVGDLGTLVVVPLAWLTVGAIVLRRTIPGIERRQPRLIRSLPRWLRPVMWRFWNDLRARFGGIVDGLRMVSRGGLVPMLTAFLVLLTVERLQPLIVLGLRMLTGPLAPFETPIFSVYLEIAARAVFFVTMVCLVAAATARLAATAEENTSTDDPAEAESDAPAGEGSPAEGAGTRAGLSADLEPPTTPPVPDAPAPPRTRHSEQP